MAHRTQLFCSNVSVSDYYRNETTQSTEYEMANKIARFSQMPKPCDCRELKSNKINSILAVGSTPLIYIQHIFTHKIRCITHVPYTH